MIEESSTVVAVKKHKYSEVHGDIVILNAENGEYYGMNSVGATVWNLIQEPKTVNEIKEAIQSKYDVELEECDRDIIPLLEKLEAKGLITSKNG